MSSAKMLCCATLGAGHTRPDVGNTRDSVFRYKKWGNIVRRRLRIRDPDGEVPPEHTPACMGICIRGGYCCSGRRPSRTVDLRHPRAHAAAAAAAGDETERCESLMNVTQSHQKPRQGNSKPSSCDKKMWCRVREACSLELTSRS